ncbi:MAG TPA: tRNA (adenosine(37)-N6)-threonylcarbamoyltransferase complex transferase subunit TsaD [Candidatus Paceibacterota bacterium]
MRILAIETSCDETAISLLETSDGKLFDVLAHEVSSQINVHKEWGGVVPMLAKREHAKNLPEILARIMNNELGIKVDLIAVTYGPGLEPALWEGINFARGLSMKWNVPLVATDHLEGHIVSALLKRMSNEQFEICKLELPAIALLISGGHTQLVLMREMGSYEVVGNTRDDAVGEAFDKVARILGLPYPGGPEISRLASHFETSKYPNIKISLPRPMLHSGDLDYSFSGLKTAVLYLAKKLKEENKGELTDEQKIAIAHEFEQAVTEVLIKKTTDAITKYGAKSLLVGGGVIANKTIRDHLRLTVGPVADSQPREVALHLPDLKFTGDNATMIGIAALLRLGFAGQAYLHPEFLLHSDTSAFAELKASGNLSLYK